MGGPSPSHPRSTKKSLPATTHAKHDLYGLIAFSRASGRTAASTVIGRICGGALEVSSVAMQGVTLFVANEYEKVWVGHILEIPMPDGLQKILTETKTAPLQVEVNPAKIEEIAKKQKFLETWEKSALEYFGKAKVQGRVTK